MSANSDRIVEALARLYRHAEDRPETRLEPLPPPLTIAMSRQAGSRGSDVARVVGARLGWPVYDHELLTRIAEEKGLHEKLLERLDERHISWLEEVVRGFCTNPEPGDNAYLQALLELLASLGKTGHCVIVGRGATHVLPADTTLRVRVVAPRDQRIAHIERTMRFNHDQAIRWVDHTDRERSRFVERHFKGPIADPLAYDLILNSGRFSVEECADLIVQAARTMQARIEPARPAFAGV